MKSEYTMDYLRATVDRYTSIVVVIAAIANIAKFTLARDSGALYMVAIIGSLSFIALAIYIRYFSGTVSKTIRGLRGG